MNYTNCVNNINNGSCYNNINNANIDNFGMQDVGATHLGIQNEDFVSKENFNHLWNNINQILSYEWNHPIIVDKALLEAVMRHISFTRDPQTTCSLNKRVIHLIRNWFRNDQMDIKIANEREEEEFDVLAHNEDTVYNPVPVPIRTEEVHPQVYVEY